MSNFFRPYSFLFGGFIGLIVFYYVYGFSIVNPAYIDWCIYHKVDLGAQYIGWVYFLHQPWQFPLGNFTGLGFEKVMSIVYTDSIPLFAIIFKLGRTFFPANFQYFGIWFLGCYILQGIFAWLLLELFSNKFLLKLVGTVFLLLSPTIIFRIEVGHAALAGQWLILAAFWLYYSSHRRNEFLCWALLNSVAMLIQAYLALMVMGIWFASLLRRYSIEKNISFTHLLKEVLLQLIIVSCCMWVIGYFSVSLAHGIEISGYEFNSMNLTAPINPLNWSIFLQPRPSISTSLEGFSYFGIGAWVLIFLAGYECLKVKLSRDSFLYTLPLLSVVVIFTFYAISPTVGIDKNVLYKINLPHVFSYITSTFRTSGRFFWPMYYFMMVGALTVIIKRNSSLKGGIVIGLCLLLQILDFSAKLKQMHYQFREPIVFKTMLMSSFWNSVPTQYNNIVFIPPVLTSPEVFVPHFIDIYYFVAIHQMQTNVAYFSRNNSIYFEQYSKQLLNQFSMGKLDAKTLYIINDDHYKKMIFPYLSSSDMQKEVDGLYIVAPHWYSKEKN